MLHAISIIDLGKKKGKSTTYALSEFWVDLSDRIGEEYHHKNSRVGIILDNWSAVRVGVLLEPLNNSGTEKLTAFDQHKKIISINDNVRILEGSVEDKRGIVKQIYKGVIFFHDENETENCGYFCAKAPICEKLEFSSNMFKGKGRKSDASGFDDFPTSPKSPLSPNKAWEGRETTRNFDQDDKEGLSVGQSCRIRSGPLKGYMCRVMAIRYLDIIVKLDSQHKILTEYKKATREQKLALELLVANNHLESFIRSWYRLIESQCDRLIFPTLF